MFGFFDFIVVFDVFYSRVVSDWYGVDVGKDMVFFF